MERSKNAVEDHEEYLIDGWSFRGCRAWDACASVFSHLPASFYNSAPVSSFPLPCIGSALQPHFWCCLASNATVYFHNPYDFSLFLFSSPTCFLHLDSPFLLPLLPSPRCSLGLAFTYPSIQPSVHSFRPIPLFFLSCWSYSYCSFLPFFLPSFLSSFLPSFPPCSIPLFLALFYFFFLYWS